MLGALGMAGQLEAAECATRVALLTGAISSAERAEVYAGLADGSIGLVVGTHAIIQEGVEFDNLAVAVIDEQHRFGVRQRGFPDGLFTRASRYLDLSAQLPVDLNGKVHNVPDQGLLVDSGPRSVQQPGFADC